jgi:GTP-binding protein
VILRAVTRLNTLSGLQHRRHYKAGLGRPGGPNQRSGRDGESLTLEVPVGTLVRDATRGHVLRDLDEAGTSFIIAPGGGGGRGNTRFKHAANQTPRRATPGQPGQTRRLRLELRLVADVGLVGRAELRQVDLPEPCLRGPAQGGRLSLHDVAPGARHRAGRR